MHGTLKFVDIQHWSTKEIKTLEVLRITLKTVDLRWPLLGSVEFDSKTGKGLKKASHWTIVNEHMKSIRKDLGYSDVTMGPLEEPDDAQKDIKPFR